MIDRLKDQQEKLILNERHEAWESIARKLAHEIKNPLTPMLLTIDRIKNKYSGNLDENDKEKFNEYLKTINKQINQIEHLINEFSDFARMPKPIFKDNNIVEILNENVKLMKQIDKETKIIFFYKKDEIFLNCDSEQISRVFLNLIKNSLESISERYKKTPNFDKKIDIEIIDKKEYIEINFTDNGLGFPEKELKNLFKPYYTTKKEGSGLGLSIVNKIVNDHKGNINFINRRNGAKINLNFPKND